jgi:phosphatidylinositol alpha-1,6-mannosyltransferase
MKKRVLLVSSEFPPGPGGIGHHAFSLAKALNHKFEIVVLCNADYIDLSKTRLFDENCGFRVIRFKRFGRVTQLNRILQFLILSWKEKPYSIIYTGLFSLWLMNFGIHNSRVKKIAIIHGHEPIFGNSLTKRLTKFSFKRADVFIPVSKFSKFNLDNRYKLKSNQLIKIIPNGLDLEYLSSWSDSDAPSKEVVQVLRGFPRLLTVGHTSPRKGQHNVISALPNIRETFPNVMYYIVGRDVNNKGLYQLAEDLGVSANIHFLPPLQEHKALHDYYVNSDIFMLLSENQSNGDVEGFGIVALEANYFGLPVIGAKGCGVEDAVRDGFSGYLVDSKNPKEIVRRLQIILENREKYSENAKKFALDFGWDEIIEQFKMII